ncbi:MAG: polyribonucleotide nucleotidyltransferase [Polyangiaceae bacterium UTPRO1]|jgi:polyribonucleotide nucleotidyltransferase|nr:polyribonucleotide nucleotidyltransferase [Myxococcales bacterium]OQY64662.1 MAG: polyribonucleotide nucleotidyltransferase [Polyangiaceae bacterium UTPRO1]
MKKVAIDFHGRPLSIEVGRMAKQAGGSAVVQYGDTVVLVTATAAREARENIDFFPLTCDYQEKTFAAGKIPGGFFKREGRQSEKEILNSRLIDRPLRPLFPEGFRCETQIVATVLSFDKENDADMPALIGASAALEVSDIPFHGPIAGVRMGRLGGQLVVNPMTSQYGESDLQLIVAGSRDAIVMVEGGAKMVSEDVILDALFTAHREIQKILDLQDELRRALGKPKRTVTPPAVDTALQKRVRDLALPKIRAAIETAGKHERAEAVRQVRSELLSALAAEAPEKEREIKGFFEDAHYDAVRGLIVEQRRRIDGRGLTDIRPITSEVGVLPRTHGSALFTRGETQALVVATLGTSSDEQKIDALGGEIYKKFMLHYNFPPYSVGEVRFLRGPGRREIGHGALAERAVAAVMPDEASFPYTVRVVSEILESNGSSSMASVCGSSLALMDAGVPIKAPVAGIAMGLIREGDEIRVLSDILGDEDHLGDMDFKVAGTADGVTAVQMDIKIGGVTREIMRDALYQAREGRLHIIGKMKEALAEARSDMSTYAPRITTLKIKVDRIRDVIGPGGKVIRGIIEETGVKIDVEDDGTIYIASSDGVAMQKAIDWVNRLTAEAEVGKIYKGIVKKIMDFGAFVEILPGTDGLVHISQLAPERVKEVRDVLKEGDEVMVKVLEVDKTGKIRLSRKEALAAAGNAR